MRIEVVEGDIARLAVDAVVNAANQTLLGGGGVDGAIHRAAGPGLLDECRKLPEIAPGVRCRTGQARITGGHRLLASRVIHTVGPAWHGGEHDEPALLVSCYRECLRLAGEDSSHNRRIGSIAFPAISCGAFGYPPQLAVPLAVREVRDGLLHAASLRRVLFCCFDRSMAELYQSELAD